MKKAVQLFILLVYLITSCFLIGVNKWTNSTNSQEVSWAEKLFSVLTIEMNDKEEGESEMVFLFKDPTDDGSIVLEYNPSITTLEYTSPQQYFYTVEKSDDPLLHIFSPPPLFS